MSKSLTMGFIKLANFTEDIDLIKMKPLLFKK